MKIGVVFPKKLNVTKTARDIVRTTKWFKVLTVDLHLESKIGQKVINQTQRAQKYNTCIHNARSAVAEGFPPVPLIDKSSKPDACVCVCVCVRAHVHVCVWV